MPKLARPEVKTPLRILALLLTLVGGLVGALALTLATSAPARAVEAVRVTLDARDEQGVRLLGDVVVAPAFAARTRDDVAAELRLLVVHGILHLLGYDHEEDAERAEMWARQERYSGVSVA